MATGNQPAGRMQPSSHGLDSTGLDRQIETIFISFSSFFKLEHARVLPTCRSKVTYKPSVQWVQTSERENIFHRLNDFITHIEKADACLMPADHKLLAGLVVYRQWGSGNVASSSYYSKVLSVNYVKTKLLTNSDVCGSDTCLEDL